VSAGGGLQGSGDGSREFDACSGSGKACTTEDAENTEAHRVRGFL